MSGSRGAAWLRDSRRRRASIPSDSCRTTSSEPSGRTSRVLAGMLFALFLTSARPGQRRSRRTAQIPVHGEEPAVGEVQHAGPEGSRRAGRRGRSPRRDRSRFPRRSSGGWRCGRAPTTRSSGRPPPRRSRTRRPATSLRSSSIVVPSSAVTSRPFHSAVSPSSASPRSRVELEDPAHGQLAEPLPGLGQGAAGRDRPRAGTAGPAGRTPSPAPGHSPRSGNRQADQHADEGHLRVQRRVVPVPGRRLPQRPRDHVLGEQGLQQALPAQLRQPVRPEPRPGGDTGRRLARDKGLRRRGIDGRQVKGHGKLAGQQGSR